MQSPVKQDGAPEPPAPDLGETALFLDLDGTLAPIAERPDLARVPPDVLRMVTRLRDLTGGATAILSGRELEGLDRLLAPLMLPAAGSHGLERRDSSGLIHRGAAVEHVRDELDEARSMLRDFADRHGLLLEEKAGGACLHFRSAPRLEKSARALLGRIGRRMPGLRVIHGHMVAELVLAGDTKGHALEAFMAEPPFSGRMPLAVGDDITDEDAFCAAQALGGAGIRIGPGETRARYRITDIARFHHWLNGLAPAGATS